MNNDVLNLVQILIETGFEHLAGELLLEVSQGREAPGDGKKGVLFDGQVEILESVGDRRPVPDDELLQFALDFLVERLVDPANALIEAGEIAGRLMQGPPATIRFIDPDTSDDRLPARRAGQEDRPAVDNLIKAVERVRRERLEMI